MICPKCNETIDDDSKFCPDCGMKIEKIQDSGNIDAKTAKFEKSRMFKIYNSYLELVNKWADENNPSPKIQKLLKTNMAQDLIDKYGNITADEFILALPEWEKLPYRAALILRLNTLWSVYHGFFLFIAERGIDKKKLVIDVDSYEKMSDKYTKLNVNFVVDTMNDINYMTKGRLNPNIDVLEKDGFKIDDEAKEKLMEITRRAIITGYYIAAANWK